MFVFTFSYSATCQHLVCQQTGPFANKALDFCSQLVHIWNFCHFTPFHSETVCFLCFVSYFVLCSFFYFTTFMHRNIATQIGLIHTYMLDFVQFCSFCSFAEQKFYNFLKLFNSQQLFFKASFKMLLVTLLFYY